MRAARVAEYRSVIEQARVAAGAAGVERMRSLRRLRGELRRNDRRDFFPPAERDSARAAVDALAAGVPATTATIEERA
jgi:hypothetical protein